MSTIREMKEQQQRTMKSSAYLLIQLRERIVENCDERLNQEIYGNLHTLRANNRD